jgi:hypothetical protein
MSQIRLLMPASKETADCSTAMTAEALLTAENLRCDYPKRARTWNRPPIEAAYSSFGCGCCCCWASG